MGGYGSGRHGGKRVTAEYRRLDVRRLQKAGALNPDHIGGWGWHLNSRLQSDIRIEAGDTSIRLRYSTVHGEERQQYDYTITLSRTRCHYGGERPWFRTACRDPVRRCGIRLPSLL